MTITSSVNKIQISSGTSITITNLEVTAASQLVVTRLAAPVSPSLESLESTLVQTTDWTVDSDLDTLTLLTAIDGTIYTRASVTISIPATQSSDYVNINPHNTEVTEADLDKTTLKLKEIQEKLDRVIAAPISTPSGSFDLPNLGGQAGKYMKLNATENGFEFADITAITFWGGFVLPSGDGTAEQILKTDGSGNINWANNSAIAGLTGLTVEALLMYDQSVPSITKSTNVTSVTDVGLGAFTINFTTAITDPDYLVMGTARGDTALTAALSQHDVDIKTTSALGCQTQTSATNFDSIESSVLILTEV